MPFCLSSSGCIEHLPSSSFYYSPDTVSPRSRRSTVGRRTMLLPTPPTSAAGPLPPGLRVRPWRAPTRPPQRTPAPWLPQPRVLNTRASVARAPPPPDQRRLALLDPRRRSRRVRRLTPRRSAPLSFFSLVFTHHVPSIRLVY